MTEVNKSDVTLLFIFAYVSYFDTTDLPSAFTVSDITSTTGNSSTLALIKSALNSILLTLHLVNPSTKTLTVPSGNFNS